MRLELPASLLAALRERQRTLPYQADEKVQEFGEAFLLDPGLGPGVYLLVDGRVILDERHFFGTEVREATPEETVAGIVVGAEKTGIRALLELLPPPPPNAGECDRCAGSRWWTVPGAGDFSVVCPDCHGKGWR